MSTKTIHDEDQKTVSKPIRDDHQLLETLGHLGLVQDKNDNLTSVDVLFNPKEASAKPKREPRDVL